MHTVCLFCWAPAYLKISKVYSHNWAISWENLYSGVCDQARHKQAIAARLSLKSLDKASIGIKLSSEQTTRTLIRLHRRACCARMRRLLCIFVDRLWHKQLLSWCGSYSFGDIPIVGYSFSLFSHPYILAPFPDNLLPHTPILWLTLYSYH